MCSHNAITLARTGSLMRGNTNSGSAKTPSHGTSRDSMSSKKKGSDLSKVLCGALRYSSNISAFRVLATCIKSAP